MFSLMKERIPDFDAVIISMNFSIALMYLSIIAGIEIVDWIIPRRVAALKSALSQVGALSLLRVILTPTSSCWWSS